MPRTSRSDIYSRRVGREIREARTAVGLTQAELARRLGVSAAYVAALEGGRSNPTVGQLAHVAEAMKVGFEVGFPVPSGDHLTIRLEESVASHPPPGP